MSHQADADALDVETYGFRLGSDDYVSHRLKAAIIDARQEAHEAAIRAREAIIDGHYHESDAAALLRAYVEHFVAELEPIMVNPEKFLESGAIESEHFKRYYRGVKLGEHSFYAEVPPDLRRRRGQNWTPAQELLDVVNYHGLASILNEPAEYVYQVEFVSTNAWGREKTKVRPVTHRIPLRILKRAIRIGDLFCQDIGIKIETGPLKAEADRD